MAVSTHYFCDECYSALSTSGKPIRDPRPAMAECCGCGAVHVSGIFERAESGVLACRGSLGIHREHVEVIQ
jgi:hypothetical protein